jgi:hypothetical protein
MSILLAVLLMLSAGHWALWRLFSISLDEESKTARENPCTFWTDEEP